MSSNILLALTTGLLAATTAVTANWVASRGNVRTTRIKAEVEAAELRIDQLRDARRSAYTSLLDYANTMKWQLIAAMNLAIEEDAPGVETIMRTRNEMVAELSRRRTVVLLDGPRTIEDVTSALGDAAVQFMLDLETGLAAPQVSDLTAHLAPSVTRLNKAIDSFLHEAQASLGTT